MRTLLPVFLICVVMTAAVGVAQDKAPPRANTAWDVRPSLKYDSLCLLNVLSGDRYYREYYNETYNRLAFLFTPAEKAAFRGLKTKIKDQDGGIISAMLALYFSTLPVESLDDLIKATRNPDQLRKSLQATSYFDEKGWKTFQAARPDLEVALTALKRVGFERYWQQTIRPAIEERTQSIREELRQYDIVPAIEMRLGRSLPSNRITVYLLHYSEPHGIKIVGTNFITHYAYPTRIVLRNAIHEMMHPPYDIAKETRVKAAIEFLRTDAFLMDKVERHSRSLGYNTLEGLAEEDCVQALEQNVAEQFAAGGELAGDPRKYWAQQDEGIHVLAVALYVLMKRHKFPASGETFSDFLAKIVQSGELATGRIRELNNAFLAEPTRPLP